MKQKENLGKKVTERLRYCRIEEAISAIEALRTSKPEQTEKKKRFLDIPVTTKNE